MLTLNIQTHEADIDGKEIYLAPKEWETCRMIGSKPGFVFSREVLLQNVWGHDSTVKIDTRTVDQYVARVRAKTKRPAIIKTVPNYGYSTKNIRVLL